MLLSDEDSSGEENRLLDEIANADVELEEDQEPARRLNGGRVGLGAAWSNYHITINSNRDEYAIRTDAFIDMCNAVMERWGEFIQYVDAHRNMRPFTTVERNELIRRVRFRVAIERNFEGRNSGVHAHIVLEVSHSTYVALNNHALQALVRDHVLPGANVFQRFIGRDDVAMTLRYILKETDEEGDVANLTNIPNPGPTRHRHNMLPERGMGQRLENAWNNRHTQATTTVHEADVEGFPDEVDGTERYPNRVAHFDDYEDRH